MKKKRQIASRKHLGVTVFLFVLTGLFFYFGWTIARHYQSVYWQLIDAFATSFTLSIRSNTLTGMMLFFSWWGLYGTIAAWIGLVLYMARKRYWVIVTLVAVLSIGGALFGYGAKQLISRERPLQHSLVQETAPSLPSNHALNSTVLYLSLTYFYYRFSRKFWLSLITFFLALLLILAISFSRLYLGVHYFSDIGAGSLFGAGIVAFALGVERIYWTVTLSMRSGRSTK